MRPWRPIFPILAVAAAPALGHHTLDAVYESSHETTMHGTVAEFRFVNPHPVLVIEVRADNGADEIWQLEMDNRFELARIGVTSDTIRPGDEVFVRGSVGLLRQRSLYLWRLDRPADGFWYEQRGLTPYIGMSKP